MESLVHLGLLNAALATVLALLAAAARCVCRRPAVIHALWLLALLKLLTPPFLPIRVASWPHEERAPTPLTPAIPRLAHTSERDLRSVSPASPGDADVPQLSKESARTDVVAIPDVQGASRAEWMEGSTPDQAPEPGDPPPATSTEALSWEQIVAAVWLSGSVLWWAIAGVRLVRFRLALRSAWPAPAALQQRTERLARQLGLSGCPRVYLLPARIMPLLWAVVGTPCLLLPPVLWARLTDAQQDTLLAHELAHLRRGDPWVRRLELLVLGLYWWHPVVWWARHEIQEAGEQCCDAWVLWSLPAAAEAYAAALLETVAFLSRLRPALPVGASGAGHSYLLRRRLTMIFQGTAPRALTWTAFGVFLAAGAILLPLRPTWGQDQPAVSAAQETSSAAPVGAGAALAGPQDTTGTGTKITDAASNSDGGLTGSIVIPRDIEEAKDTVELLQVQLEGKKAELLEARALLQQARQQLQRGERLKERGTIAEEEFEQRRTDVAVREARLHVKEAQIREGEIRLRQANRWLSRLQSGARVSGSTGGSGAAVGQKPSNALPGETIGRASVGVQSTQRPTTGGISSSGGTSVGSYKAPAGSNSAVNTDSQPPPSDRRIRDLEKKLDLLLKEVETLRSEIRGAKPSGSNSAAPADSVNKPLGRR
jgi:beta-lactamase regulating signal transducer with metallopeptidase domain